MRFGLPGVAARALGHVGARLPIVAALGSALVPTPAAAGTRADVEALASAWTGKARVTRVKPRMLDRGVPQRLILPLGAYVAEAPGCTTVAVLGARSAAFTLSAAAAPGEAPLWVEAAVAGAVEVTRCGRSRSEFARLVVEVRSPHVVLRALVASGEAALPALAAVLPHRDVGVVDQSTPRGRRVHPGPLAPRVAAAVARAQREGAAQVVRSTVQAGHQGQGETWVEREAGCHRVHAFAEPPPSGGEAADLDLLALDAEGNLVAGDRSEAPDATVEFCLGRASGVKLRFAGAPTGGAVTLVHGFRPLPGGLPVTWTDQGRASVARALGADLGLASDPPVFEALGVAGLTSLPFRAQAGSCYVAAVGGWVGAAAGIALGVEAEGEVRMTQHLDPGQGTRLAFCSATGGPVRLMAEARGQGFGWVLAVWPAGRFTPGTPR